MSTYTQIEKNEVVPGTERTPRGPLTTGTAIASMVISLIAGGGVGFLLRSRWAMVLAPATFITVLELTRLSVDGPMVDAIHMSFSVSSRSSPDVG